MIKARGCLFMSPMAVVHRHKLAVSDEGAIHEEGVGYIGARDGARDHGNIDAGKHVF